MPPTARISSVEFRPLLLPPIRIPFRAIRTLCRPQCASRVLHAAHPPQCLGQHRALHLYKTAKAKTVLGQHKVLTFSQYSILPPSASEHTVNLVKSDTDATVVAENISLQKLYEDHVKPGHMLYITQQPKKVTAERYDKLKDEKVPDEFKTYAIVRDHKHQVPIKNKQNGDQYGGLKCIMINLSSPTPYYKLSLDRAYQFVEAGSPVEVRTRLKGAKLTKTERLQPGDPEAWPWMHKHFPHLRPDFILKAMPEGTVYIVNPVSDGRIVQWVMSLPVKKKGPIDLTTRLLRVQESVKKSITQGQQGQLPRTMRQQLAESGLTDYSPNTGMPKTQAREKFGRGGEHVTWGSEEKKKRVNDEAGSKFLVSPYTETLNRKLGEGFKFKKGGPARWGAPVNTKRRGTQLPGSSEAGSEAGENRD
ncbi:hypothetical protein EJ02DRAFT_270558 [Clathrospora elynae]|uniref:Uncharacterized protein n=1 Tax=Clathrospora elynae TaxID=706981 RepID=A0A6A5SGW9_9PLEO|nr:hypothetical protein EJ02DRAFT_270558 [Clathrospora elynae]